MLKNSKHHNQAFTLVEIMVAVSIFAIVATITVSALLSANAVNNKAQAIKLAMDNLNYALDSIAIKMKFGTNFSFNDTNAELTFESPKDSSATGVAKEYYTYHLNSTDGPLGFLEMKKDFGDYTPITSITNLDIKTFKVDANPTTGPTGDAFGRAVIAIEGRAIVGNQEQKFAVETAVTER